MCSNFVFAKMGKGILRCYRIVSQRWLFRRQVFRWVQIGTLLPNDSFCGSSYIPCPRQDSFLCDLGQFFRVLDCHILGSFATVGGGWDLFPVSYSWWCQYVFAVCSVKSELRLECRICRFDLSVPPQKLRHTALQLAMFQMFLPQQSCQLTGLGC